MSIGPVLPPDWKPSRSSDEDEGEDIELSTTTPYADQFGPDLPTDLLQPDSPENSGSFGPKLPSELTADSSNGREEEDCYGPALPPDLLNEKEEKGGGDSNESESDGEGGIGPSLPPEDLEKDYEERLLRFKHQEMLKEMGKPKREEWMTALPKKLQNYGLGARTFAKRGVESSEADHSAWTDSPVDKQRKKMEGSDVDSSSSKCLTSKGLEKRDRDLEERAQEMNKNRSESLVDIHQKKRGESEEAGSSKIERRPFDRDLDLNVSKVSAHGTKKIVERATKLGSRFGHGTQQKFL